eukprot:TRINITY_DN20489_c0_g1_i1.p1 TRINITY_DN20489_c0_g1~~TRINITY_DN20489_c0_g1_i1.p1  ORF type:complete len:222 (+),score=29.79 TRINITY_DN20489_c0_g1_i1:51-716(+)
MHSPWRSIKKVVARYQKTSRSTKGPRGEVFGVSLGDILAREKRIDGIPFIVRRLVDHLQSHIETEGLFRMSGPSAELGELKASFTKGRKLDLSKFSVHTSAQLLKNFFRDLHDPIFPPDFCSAVVAASAAGPDSYLAELARAVAMIAPQEKILLSFLLRFLGQVESHSSINKMTAANLCTMFGPNLFKTDHINLTESAVIFQQSNQALDIIWRSADLLGLR